MGGFKALDFEVLISKSIYQAGCSCSLIHVF